VSSPRMRAKTGSQGPRRCIRSGGAGPLGGVPDLKVNDMSLRGRIGGHAKAAKYGGDELTEAARRGFLCHFTPDDPTLSDEERTRRGRAALRAHMAKLARKSALARVK